ncbi:hypothetical protein [Clostridium drakei]|uniref:Uncharacterized protein n=1 Tax=Clostridium drakei TaxID=332101 RepID=A0A2U8DL87_9CLOT|nr:hypothetical protein [Clostridium drakei]AWI03433.1 hypothetical protein B9W14_02640 [Clostridium drakei]
MKDKVLSTIALITIFVPLTVVFFWKPDNPNATVLLIGYFIFVAISFCYALFLFAKKRLRDTDTKVSLGVNSLYLVGILVFVVIPHII